MSALFWPVLAASLAGSLHCAGMCGPFQAAAAGFGTGRAQSLWASGAYHAGRLLTYLGFGVLAGVVGSALDLAGQAAGIARVSALVAGALMVLWGATHLVQRVPLVTLERRAPRRWGSWLGQHLARLSGKPPLVRSFVLGLSTTLLPCGWLYAFVATAAGTGSVPSALVVMSAFWLGTVPLLLFAGLGLREIAARFGARSRAVSAALILASGVLLIGVRVHAESHESTNPGAPASCPLHRR